MNRKLGMGITAALLAAVSMAPGVFEAEAAVTVIGNGIARDCFIAVKEERLTTSKAMEICDLALEQEVMSTRNRAATLVNRGILQMRAGNFDRALRDYDLSIRMKGDLYEAHVNRGAALYSLKRFEESRAALTVGLKSEEQSALVAGYYNRGLANEQLGDLTAAYYDYKAALEIDPAFKSAYDQMSRFTVKVVSD